MNHFYPLTLKPRFIKISILSALAFFLFSISTYEVSAQCVGAFTIFTEDFEDNGNTANGGFGRYSSPFDFKDGGSDFWGRVQGSNDEYFLTNAGSGSFISSLTPYAGWNNNFYYAGEDLDDTGASIGVPDGQGEKGVVFTGINITDATNMCFSGLFAVGNTNGCGSSGYDAPDYIKIFYSIDGAPELEAMCWSADLSCNGDNFNEPLMSDAACGGSGAYLTATLTEYTFSIVGSGASLDLRIEAHVDSGNEEIAFDFFQIKSDSAVPIKLQGFNAKKERGNVILDWATASEVNNAYFLVEHSLDGKRFQEIGMVYGAGNSTMSVEYDFTHETPSSAVNYYRLKQVDFDGESSYSPIVDVNFKSETDKITISPNPFNGEISLTLDNAFDTDINIKIYDPIGRLVISQTLSKGHNQKRMNLSDLDSGVYFLQVGEGNNRIIQKITKY